MTRDEFARLTGDTLVHVSARQNAPGIAAHGLLSAASLAARAGRTCANITLRNARTELRAGDHAVRLNHQKPLRMGMGKDAGFLDGHTLRSWAEQLDHRVFLWPGNRNADFAASFEIETDIYTLDARSVFDRFAKYIFLSPINSGTAARKPARRGDWLYVPATATLEDFRENRRRRGLVKARDSLSEVSLTCPIPATEFVDLVA